MEKGKVLSFVLLSNCSLCCPVLEQAPPPILFPKAYKVTALTNTVEICLGAWALSVAHFHRVLAGTSRAAL